MSENSPPCHHGLNPTTSESEDCECSIKEEQGPCLKLSRNGKWTEEEELYTGQLVQLFMSGQIYDDIIVGETLRSYLSRKLHCKPMRVTKKFTSIYELSARYQPSGKLSQSIDVDETLLNNFELNFRIKDVSVQSNRLKRKKYYKHNSTEKSMRINECSPSIIVEGEPLSESLETISIKSDFSFDFEESNIDFDELMSYW
mmetsp:Transcript_37463/g.38148  ORF Transcript_37463/g.38148 Transcript_37463/m.38148 type:complete len:200 (-) Transcript_37463:494-1093(-)